MKHALHQDTTHHPVSPLDLIEMALESHAAYTQTIREKILGGSLVAADIDTIRRDDCCRIGRWFELICEEHGQNPDFLAVCAEHSRFHNQLATVAQRWLDGEGSASLREVDAILAVTGGAFHDLLEDLTRFLKAVSPQQRRQF